MSNSASSAIPAPVPALAAASSVETVLPGVLRWSAYSPAHKVELTSHAVAIESGTGLVFDPIPLIAEIWDWFPPAGPPLGIVLTNDNHERDTAAWRALFPVPVWAPPEFTAAPAGLQKWNTGPDPGSPYQGWNIVPLPGGAPGESAWYCAARSLVVFGDAVVNLEGRTLELLPDKYCTDPARLRQSLRALVEREFDHALFAHGNALIGSASRRIAALL